MVVFHKQQIDGKQRNGDRLALDLHVGVQLANQRQIEQIKDCFKNSAAD